jgi:hypothetical protein
VRKQLTGSPNNGEWSELQEKKEGKKRVLIVEKKGAEGRLVGTLQKSTGSWDLSFDFS